MKLEETFKKVISCFLKDQKIQKTFNDFDSRRNSFDTRLVEF